MNTYALSYPMDGEYALTWNRRVSWKRHFTQFRSIIQKGAEMLGVEIGELIEDIINGMREVAVEIGLEGDPAVDIASDS